MKMTGKLVYGAALGTMLLALALNTQLATAASTANTYTLEKDKTEAELIQDLASTNSDRVITDAMTQLERRYDHGISVSNTYPALINLLSDNRSPVRRKAGRVLGVLHAPLSDADIKVLCRQLHASDWGEVQSAVKALRDLNATSAVPELVPLLQHPNSSVVRDTCRTLAVIGDQSVIPAIEPLMKNPKRSVAKDAQDAVVALKGKSWTRP
ncbi:MAG TPA: HEAT repeat domain-containing protein [Verrucomicrobiae bacterium]|nr:HEAT repeat domain-containing protein [Verrucomicrobiae bacterium]